jgi:hypothetical protein
VRRHFLIPTLLRPCSAPFVVCQAIQRHTAIGKAKAKAEGQAEEEDRHPMKRRLFEGEEHFRRMKRLRGTGCLIREHQCI